MFAFGRFLTVAKIKIHQGLAEVRRPPPSLVSQVLFNLLPHLSSLFNSIFRHFDSDHSGSIEGSELTDALRQFGYNLSPQIIQLVVAKYGLTASISGHRHHSQAHGGAGGFSQLGGSSSITFDRFVRACVVVRTLTEAFQKMDTDRDGWIQLNYDQFLQTVLTLP